MQAQIIPSANIDAQKWDACVQSSGNALIYACSFYLNHMADNWSGIVLGDYETVMPVPWRKKAGIRYAYDVPFVPQLGWFAAGDNADNVSELMTAFFKFVKCGSYSFNYNNAVTAKEAAVCNNYIIPLTSSYVELTKGYSGNAAASLKNAERNGVFTRPGCYKTVIAMYRLAYQNRFANTRDKDYENFTALCGFLQEKQMLFALEAVNEANGEPLSASIFLQYNCRIYNIMPVTTQQGRKTGAGYCVVNAVLRQFAGTGQVFDFEGSDIPGIKHFYENFGAINQPYQRLEKFNRLPFPLSLLK